VIALILLCRNWECRFLQLRCKHGFRLPGDGDRWPGGNSGGHGRELENRERPSANSCGPQMIGLGDASIAKQNCKAHKERSCRGVAGETSKKLNRGISSCILEFARCARFASLVTSRKAAVPTCFRRLSPHDSRRLFHHGMQKDMEHLELQAFRYSRKWSAQVVALEGKFYGRFEES